MAGDCRRYRRTPSSHGSRRGGSSPMEVMIEKLQADERIPRGIPFRKGMRFASEGIEPITESAVDSLDVNSTGFGNNFAQSGTDLNRKEFSMLIPVLDGLRQRNTPASTHS